MVFVVGKYRRDYVYPGKGEPYSCRILPGPDHHVTSYARGKRGSFLPYSFPCMSAGRGVVGKKHAAHLWSPLGWVEVVCARYLGGRCQVAYGLQGFGRFQAGMGCLKNDHVGATYLRQHPGSLGHHSVTLQAQADPWEAMYHQLSHPFVPIGPLRAIFQAVSAHFFFDSGKPQGQSCGMLSGAILGLDWL